MTRRELRVPGEQDGWRLDRSLAVLVDDWSRSQIRRWIDRGLVTVNGSRVRASQPVRTGDRVAVDQPPAKPSDLVAEEIPLRILYEDEHLLAIDKPSGLPIHPAAGNPSGTLVNALLHHCDDLSGIGGVERPGIVHRLDKQTTGVIVVAKHDRAHLALSLAFRQRRVSKHYVAVCYGSPAGGEWIVDAPIGRHRRNRRQMAVVADGRPARTLVEVRETLAGSALVECRPVTGRTHQIRVHLAHVGHALVGDPLYAGRQWRMLPESRQRDACRDFPRQALHAWKLSLAHPVSGTEMMFEAPWPDDLNELVDSLRAR